LQITGGFVLLWRLVHANFAQVAETCMQIFPILHVRGSHLGSICMQLAAKRLIDLVCIAASWIQNFNSLAAIVLESRQFFCNDAGSICIEKKKNERQIFKNQK